MTMGRASGFAEETILVAFATYVGICENEYRCSIQLEE
jgi:hypothetical protein